MDKPETVTQALKPCPLDAEHGAPSVRSVPGDERNGYAETVTIECPICKISVTHTDEQPTKRPFYAKSGTGFKNAIAAWNTRPAETATRAQALREAAEVAMNGAKVWRDFAKMSLPAAPSPVINEDRARTAEGIATAILALIPETNDG